MIDVSGWEGSIRSRCGLVACPTAQRSCVVEPSTVRERNCDPHDTFCRQFLTTGSRTTGAYGLAILFETGLCPACCRSYTVELSDMERSVEHHQIISVFFSVY